MPRAAYIANTGGSGVIWRDECQDTPRRSGDGWIEGTAITIVENGSGQCEGWFRTSDDDGVTSWVSGEYLSEEPR